MVSHVPIQWRHYKMITELGDRLENTLEKKSTVAIHHCYPPNVHFPLCVKCFHIPSLLHIASQLKHG